MKLFGSFLLLFVVALFVFEVSGKKQKDPHTGGIRDTLLPKTHPYVTGSKGDAHVIRSKIEALEERLADAERAGLDDLAGKIRQKVDALKKEEIAATTKA